MRLADLIQLWLNEQNWDAISLDVCVDGTWTIYIDKAFIAAITYSETTITLIDRERYFVPTGRTEIDVADPNCLNKLRVSILDQLNHLRTLDATTRTNN